MIVITFLLILRPSRRRCDQCDQIRNIWPIGQFFMYLAIFWGLCKFLNLIRHKKFAFGQIFFVVNGQILVEQSCHLVTLVAIQSYYTNFELPCNQISIYLSFFKKHFCYFKIYRDKLGILTTTGDAMNILQLKRAIFFVYFRLFELTLQFLQQMYVKNVRPVYGAGI